MKIEIIKDEIPIYELKKIAEESFGDLIKAVVDIENEVMAIGGELHADEEALLIEQGAEQNNLWGINLYPDIKGEDWIEFDSIINIRPSQGNLTRGIDNPQIRRRIIQIVNKLVKR
jgi:hypothetical protein